MFLLSGVRGEQLRLTTKECYSHWSNAGGPGCVSAAYYMLSILAGLNGRLPCHTTAHGHAFANRVPELYN
jgi:hypothetical protein